MKMLSRYLVLVMLGVLPFTAAAQGGIPNVEKFHHEAVTPMIIPRTGERVPLPRTDAEVLRLLDYPDAMITTITRNLYHTYRLMGHDVLTAYEKTLTSVIEAGPAGAKDTAPSGKAIPQ